MSDRKIITLLTDFGDRDVYVGVMKGTIAQIDPRLKVIDLTHHIAPQNILAARFALSNAYPYFPTDTVHVAVVDPGVGSNRKGIAIALQNGYLVCPDNGLCSGILDSAIAAVELTNTQYWRVPHPSNTFQGRDIFAPVGAHLARGIPLEQLGHKVDLKSLVRLDLPAIKVHQSHITGCIQYLDHFGNLITNISGALVENKSWQIIIKDREINSHRTYSDVNQGKAVTLIGSHGWVEIAVNSGNAAEQFQLREKDPIQLKFN